MDISQWIGLFILLLAMVVSVVRKIYETFDRQRNPEKYRKAREEQERLLRELFGDMDMQLEDEESAPRPASAPVRAPARPGRVRSKKAAGMKKGYEFHSTLDEYEKPLSSIESRELMTSIESQDSNRIVSERFRKSSEQVPGRTTQTSRGKKLISRGVSFRDAFVMKELLEPPVALRDSESWMSPPATEPPESSSNKSA